MVCPPRKHVEKSGNSVKFDVDILSGTSELHIHMQVKLAFRNVFVLDT